MNIGTLTGRIQLEDQLSGHLSLISSRVSQFAKSFDGAMGATALAMGAVSAAVVGLTGSIIGLAVKGSVINGVEEAFNRLAVSAGSTGEALIGGLTEGVRGTIDSMVLMQSTTRLLSSGIKLTADDMKLMGATAREMGKATGTDAAQGLNILSSALMTGNTRSLKRFGININLIKSEKEFAASLGTTRDHLNEAGRMEARRIAMLEGMRVKLDTLGASELTFKERIQQATVAIGGWFDNLAKAVAKSPAVNAAFDAISTSIVKTFGSSSQTLLQNLIGWVDNFAVGVARIAPAVVETIGKVKSIIVEIWNQIVAFNDRWQITNNIVTAAKFAWDLLKGAFDLVRSAVVAVIRAWESMPEWLQRITRTGLEAAAALSVYSLVIGAAATPVRALISSIDLTINIIGNLTGAVYNLSHMTNVWTGVSALATKATGLLSAAKTWLAGATIAATINMNLLAASAGRSTGALALTALVAKGAAAAFTALGVAIRFVLLPLAALVVGYKVGTWLEQNTRWARELSDAFEYAALRVRGFSAAQADAIITSDHTIEAMQRNKRAVDDLAAAQAQAAAEEERRQRQKLTGEDVAIEVENLRRRYAQLTKEGKVTVEVIKNVGAAAEELRQRGGRLHPEIALLADASVNLHAVLPSVAGDFINLGKDSEEFQKKVRDLIKSYREGDEGLRVFTAAFAGLNDSQRANFDVLKRAVPEIDKLIAAGATLTDQQVKAIAAYEQETIALTEKENKLLETSDITLDVVRIMKEQGLTERDIARHYNVSTEALSRYLAKKQEDFAHDQAQAAFRRAELERMASHQNAMMKILMDSRMSLEEMIRQETMTTTEIELFNLNRWVEESLRAYDENEAGYAEYAANIRRMADMKRQALFVDNQALKANSIQTLEETRDRAWNTWKEMERQPEKYSQATRIHFLNVAQEASRTAAGIKAWDHEIVKSIETVDILAQHFVALAQIGGESFGSLMQMVGGLFQSLSTGKKVQHEYASWVKKEFGEEAALGVKDFGIATPLFDKNATAAQKWSAGISSAVTIANGAMEVWNVTANTGSKATGAFLGAASGAKVGAAFGPWGAAIGGAVGAIVGLIRGGNAGKKAIEEFAKSFDTIKPGSGMAEMHDELRRLGTAGEEMWKKMMGIKGDKKAAEEMIAKVKAELAALDADIQKYNLTWADMANAQTGAQKAGDALMESYKRLTGAGYSVENVTRGMSAELNAYIAEVLRSGTKISAAMEPVVKRLIEMGGLTAANAAGMLNLGKQEGLDRLKAQLKTVTDSLADLHKTSAAGWTETGNKAQAAMETIIALNWKGYDTAEQGTKEWQEYQDAIANWEMEVEAGTDEVYNLAEAMRAAELEVIRLNYLGYDTAERGTAEWQQYQDAVADWEDAVAAAGTTTSNFSVDQLEQLEGLEGQYEELTQEIKDYEEAMRKATEDSLMPSLKDIKEAADRYGLSLDELGPKVQQLQITETANQIVKDFELLSLAGADFTQIMKDTGTAADGTKVNFSNLGEEAQKAFLEAGGTVEGMHFSIQKLVSQSLTMKMELPAAMKPIIERMIEAGMLTDDLGTKLTDTSKLTFAADLSKMFESLILKLDELIDKIGTGVGGAFDNLGRKAVPPIRVPYYYEQEGSGMPSGASAAAAPAERPERPQYVATGGVIYAQMGTAVSPFVAKGTDTVPAMLTPGEGVVTTKGMGMLGASGLASINTGNLSRAISSIMTRAQSDTALVSRAFAGLKTQETAVDHTTLMVARAFATMGGAQQAAVQDADQVVQALLRVQEASQAAGMSVQTSFVGASIGEAATKYASFAEYLNAMRAKEAERTTFADYYKRVGGTAEVAGGVLKAPEKTAPEDYTTIGGIRTPGALDDYYTQMKNAVLTAGDVEKVSKLLAEIHRLKTPEVLGPFTDTELSAETENLHEGLQSVSRVRLTSLDGDITTVESSISHTAEELDYLRQKFEEMVKLKVPPVIIPFEYEQTNEAPSYVTEAPAPSYVASGGSRTPQTPTATVPYAPPTTPTIGTPTRTIAEAGTQEGMTVIIQQDGRKSAEWLVPYIPGAVQRFGLV